MSSVKARLDCEEGISFTEFTYQLLQAYDFYELNRKLNCTVQIGGSDQWGNILSGVDLISKLGESGQTSRDRAFGITTPLLTTSSGSKISKSSGNAVWLDRSRTSFLDFYQASGYNPTSLSHCFNLSVVFPQGNR
jgi:tyrosyl-tRNA synthetase